MQKLWIQGSIVAVGWCWYLYLHLVTSLIYNCKWLVGQCSPSLHTQNASQAELEDLGILCIQLSTKFLCSTQRRTHIQYLSSQCTMYISALGTIGSPFLEITNNVSSCSVYKLWAWCCPSQGPSRWLLWSPAPYLLFSFTNWGWFVDTVFVHHRESFCEYHISGLVHAQCWYMLY